MKVRNLVLSLALTTAALLPTLAYSSDNTDEVRASFDRAFNSGFEAQYSPTARIHAESLHAIKAALVFRDPDRESDLILASFERVLFRRLATFEIVQFVNPDPLDAIFAVLNDVRRNG